jgi:stress-induced morphogen
MTPLELQSKIETLSPETQVEITDLTGTMDHYQAVIYSSAFESKTKIEQHQIVFKLLKEELSSGELHALTLKTYTRRK